MRWTTGDLAIKAERPENVGLGSCRPRNHSAQETEPTSMSCWGRSGRQSAGRQNQCLCPTCAVGGLGYFTEFDQRQSVFQPSLAFRHSHAPKLEVGRCSRRTSPQLCEERNDVYAKRQEAILEGETLKYLDALIDVSKQVVRQGKVHPEIQRSIASHPANMLQELLRTMYTTKIA